MAKLTVWHDYKHDDATTTELTLPINVSARDWTDKVFKDGGFWDGSAFVPWHRINYIELEI